jgi:hypothetical protein
LLRGEDFGRRDRTPFGNVCPHRLRPAVVEKIELRHLDGRHLIAAPGDVRDLRQRNRESVGGDPAVAHRRELVQCREHEKSDENGDGDHDALPLPGELHDVLGGGDVLRLKDFLEQRLCIDTLARLRISAAEGTEFRRCVDRPLAGCTSSLSGHQSRSNDISTV